MISVIVPVYKVEPYLPRCLDSIVSQTYGDLEIILIDDGSPDRCGEICDAYAESDPRIRVLHTENRGIAAARNLGIDNSHGERLVFIDSDDWVEENMLELLLKASEESGADVTVCNRMIEYPDGSRITREPLDCVLCSEEAVRYNALLKIKNCVWDKLWNRECFNAVRFPEGRVFEDTATTYRVFMRSEKIRCIPDALVHYRIRDDSISHLSRLTNVLDHFLSFREQYENIALIPPYSEDPEIPGALGKRCAVFAVRVWSDYFKSTKAERKARRDELRSVSEFVRDNYRLLTAASGFGRSKKLLLRLCRFPALWAYAAATMLAGAEKKRRDLFGKKKTQEADA